MTQPQAQVGIPARAVPFVTRVRLNNYKSIASCDVRLGPLTFLVGPNGSGKSNFLDALAFLCRALATTPGEAIESRGGAVEILRRVPEPTDSFSIALEAKIPWGPLEYQLVNAAYEVSIGLPARRGPRSKLVAAGGIERAVQALAIEVTGKGGILILFDTDDDCPAELAPQLLARARAVRPDKRIAVVLANREFEAWFLAALPSLAGRNGFPDDLLPLNNPETPGTVKGNSPEPGAAAFPIRKPSIKRPWRRSSI